MVPINSSDPLFIKVLTVAPADPAWSPLATNVWKHARDFMSRYDPSHDFGHIRRVLSLALAIYDRTTVVAAKSPPLCARTVVLAALLHDVGDKKYLRPGDDPSTMARDALVAAGADGSLAARVQAACTGVSYSAERADPDRAQRLLAQVPELAVVQDADRLDAIGAVGIGRAFSYNSARATFNKVVPVSVPVSVPDTVSIPASIPASVSPSVPASPIASKAGSRGGAGARAATAIATATATSKAARPGKQDDDGMAEVLRHFDEKLVWLEGMMKTAAGREMARQRTERLRIFQQWWEEETAMAGNGRVTGFHHML